MDIIDFFEACSLKFNEHCRLAEIEQELNGLYLQLGKQCYNDEGLDFKEVSLTKKAISNLIEEKEKIILKQEEDPVQYCQNCGEECQKGDSFCCSCGTKLRN